MNRGDPHSNFSPLKLHFFVGLPTCHLKECPLGIVSLPLKMLMNEPANQEYEVLDILQMN